MLFFGRFQGSLCRQMFLQIIGELCDPCFGLFQCILRFTMTLKSGGSCASSLRAASSSS